MLNVGAAWVLRRRICVANDPASEVIGDARYTFPIAAVGPPGNNPFCHHRALELARQGLRERIVRTQAPEGLPFDHGPFEIVEEPLPDR